jgi:hypothetical protein
MSRPKEGYHSMNVYLPEDKVQPFKVYAAQHQIPGGASELICRLALERWEQLQGGGVEVKAPSAAPTPDPGPLREAENRASARSSTPATKTAAAAGRVERRFGCGYPDCKESFDTKHEQEAHWGKKHPILPRAPKGKAERSREAGSATRKQGPKL